MLLNFKHLLGFNQLDTVCKAADNPVLLGDIGRLSNKIGTGETRIRIENIGKLANKISEPMPV